VPTSSWDTIQKAHYALAQGVPIFGPDCAVVPATPVENLRAIRQVAKGIAVH